MFNFKLKLVSRPDVTPEQPDLASPMGRRGPSLQQGPGTMSLECIAGCWRGKELKLKCYKQSASPDVRWLLIVPAQAKVNMQLASIKKRSGEQPLQEAHPLLPACTSWVGPALCCHGMCLGAVHRISGSETFLEQEAVQPVGWEQRELRCASHFTQPSSSFLPYVS